MPRAVILHGTDGSPNINWIPWAKDLLESKGYEVWVPQLPECHTPSALLYNDFLSSADWDFSNNLIIGHSSGATTILNLLSSDWFPVIDKAVLVGAFLNEDKLHLTNPDWYDEGQFDHLFPNEFDPSVIKRKSRAFVFIHSVDDPYCSYDDAQVLCRQLGGSLHSVNGGAHLSSNRKELPELLTHI